MPSLQNIRKSFGRTIAVDGASLEIREGEILALVGENGAGKTTLMRIAAGEIKPDAGTVKVDGHLELVHQHFMLVPELSIAGNLALSDARRLRFVTRRRVEHEAALTIAASGIDLTGPERLVSSLSVGEKARLELIKAIARRPSTLVLDEPTSVLTPVEADDLFRVMRRLAREGTAVVFISHKLPEVLAVASRIVVMRGGRVVGERLASETTASELARAMVGEIQVVTARSANGAAGAARSASAPCLVLEMRGVSGSVLRDVDLSVRGGEIVAILGVAGNGQGELAAILRGLARPREGRLSIAGRSAHIAEDRTRDGIVAEMTIAENLALGRGRWSRDGNERHARRMIELYSIRSTGPSQRAGDLSGGNQQKLILARELDPRPELIVAAEPTRGLDIEAAAFVHAQIRIAVSSGSGVLLVTSDLDEAFALADAVHVLYRGTLSARLSPAQAADRLAELMTGVA